MSKLPIYFTKEELDVLFDAIDVMVFCDGQTHDYTDKQRKAAEKAKSKIGHEINNRNYKKK